MAWWAPSNPLADDPPGAQLVGQSRKPAPSSAKRPPPGGQTTEAGRGPGLSACIWARLAAPLAAVMLTQMKQGSRLASDRDVNRQLLTTPKMG